MSALVSWPVGLFYICGLVCCIAFMNTRSRTALGLAIFYIGLAALVALLELVVPVMVHGRFEPLRTIVPSVLSVQTYLLSKE